MELLGLVKFLSRMLEQNLASWSPVQGQLGAPGASDSFGSPHQKQLG